MHEFQGDLKDISENDLDNLCKEIVETGFAFSPHVWKNPADGTWNIVDAHQRKKALCRLEERGYSIPKFHTIEVEADSFEQAKRRVLQGTSNYGKMTERGLADFAKIGGIKFETLGNFRFPEVKLSAVQTHLRSGNEKNEDEVPEPPKVARTKRGELWLFDPYYECDSCKKIYSYEDGKSMEACPCG